MTGIGTGFRHIIPEGLDHMLLVLGLCLQSRDARSLLIQVTLFTFGHSLTLALSVLGQVSFSERAVEIVVALSIVFIAVENLFPRPLLGRWRWPLVLAIGLVHGLAFAHAMPDEMGAADKLIPHLLGYSLGIELGQLLVVIAALLVLAPLWRQPFYRNRVVLPACVGIAAFGLWLLCRHWLAV